MCRAKCAKMESGNFREVKGDQKGCGDEAVILGLDGFHYNR